MKKVKIISGSYGHKENGKITVIRLGKCVDVTEEEAARLVALKVAEEVAPEEQDFGAGDDFIVEPSSTIQGEKTGEEAHLPPEYKGTPAHLDADDLREMTVPNLIKLAEDMGIDTKDLRKAEIIEALVAKEVYIDVPEAAPNLDSEDVVQ